MNEIIHLKVVYKVLFLHVIYLFVIVIKLFCSTLQTTHVNRKVFGYLMNNLSVASKLTSLQEMTQLQGCAATMGNFKSIGIKCSFSCARKEKISFPNTFAHYDSRIQRNSQTINLSTCSSWSTFSP